MYMPLSVPAAVLTGLIASEMQVQLLHNKEVVCMALCDQLVAVGSHSHVSLIDPRSHLPVKDVLSTDPSHGGSCIPLLKMLLSVTALCRMGLRAACFDTPSALNSSALHSNCQFDQSC